MKRDFIENRVRKLNSMNAVKNGPVVYWMSRDQRIEDNWALIYAQNKASEIKQNIKVVFCVVPAFSEATLRQYNFMLKGLEEVEKSLHEKNINFEVLIGNPETQIPKYLKENNAGILITDFSSLNISPQWKNKIKKEINIPFYEADAHNIVPVWIASQKQEYAARYLRKKINKKLGKYLTSFPKIKKQNIKVENKNNWKKIYSSLKVDPKVKPVDGYKPGSKEAQKILTYFLRCNLRKYEEYSNNPVENVLSDLSPYLHFGQISAQKIALKVKASKASKKDKEAFLEQLIIRKELSDNFCFYNKKYGSLECIPEWAKKTLKKHTEDRREYVYKKSEFEKAKTHDDLWNAAQLQMVKTGKMHGYLRMYWAKKILEWTKTPQQAFDIALYLNDKYELDGRDPNGYVGILWSIGGVHDRPWPERKVFGTIRYMNYNGMKKKFKIQKYIDKFLD